MFVTETGYECYNFVVTKDDKIIMDALLYGDSDESICIADEVLDELDKELKEEKRRKWKRIIFPFFRQ